MVAGMGSILRAATRRPDEPLNVLYQPLHERFDSNLSRVNAQFYLVRNDKLKDWCRAYAKLPDNFHLLPRNSPQLPPDVRFDLAIAGQKFGAFQTVAPIANYLQIPLLCVEHTLPMPEWSPSFLSQLKGMRGHVNAFISEFSRERWGWKEGEAVVVHHGVDTDTFSPAKCLRQPYVLSVVNDFRNRDWCCGYRFWEEATGGLGRKHLGDSPDGWSRPARDVADLVHHYRECAVFVDTASASPIPTVLLEALSCGAICVSRGNAMVKEVITDGVNGFIREDPKSMRALVKDILANPGRYSHVKEAARQTILERFSLSRFVEDWDRVLRMAANTPWTGPI